MICVALSACVATTTGPGVSDEDGDGDEGGAGGDGDGDEGGAGGGPSGQGGNAKAGAGGGTAGVAGVGGSAGGEAGSAGGAGGDAGMNVAGAGAGGATVDTFPPGTLPVVIAVGDGGFTMASCDRGRTWKNKQQFSGERGDHTQWTAFGGVAHGAGRIVAGFGWGAPGHITSSDSGTSFSEVPDASFTVQGSAGGLNDSIGGVAFTGDEFIALSRYLWRSTDGLQWVGGPGTLPRGAEQLRQLRGFPRSKLVVASVESQSGNGHPRGNFVVVSENGGRSWSEGTGFDPACANFIQHTGDIAMVGDVIVVATERVCRSEDRGKTWKGLGQPTGASVSWVFSDGASFYAISGGRLHKSVDGQTWMQLSAPPGGAELGAIADGGFVVMKGDASNIMHSPDGKTWSKADRIDTGGQRLRDLIVAPGKATATCPPP